MCKNKCKITGKFISDARVKFLKSLETARETSLVFALLLAVAATAIAVS